MESSNFSKSNTLPVGLNQHKLGALLALALLWVIGMGVALSPMANSVEIKALFLAMPMALTGLLVILDPKIGFMALTLGLTVLITQTGFQLDIGSVRTSALEVVVVFGLLVLLFQQRRNQLFGVNLQLPGAKYWRLFVVYAVITLIINLVRGVAWYNVLVPFKGFLLYPSIAYLVWAGLHSYKSVQWASNALILAYILIAGVGLSQFSQGGAVDGGELVRASGNYASINIFGITLTAVSLLTLGISLKAKRLSLKYIGIGIALWLFVGAVTSVSRTVGVAFLCGLLSLWLVTRSAKGYIIFLAVLIPIGLYFLLPSEAIQRIWQLSDSSTDVRIFYLISGFEAWKARWLLGWGWGVAFLYDPVQGLVPASSYPWYHNDYLNLAVQTGLVGLSLYVAFWQRNLSTAYRWLKTHTAVPMTGYVQGSFAALVSLLAGAAFEHVVWRTDIAGLVGWLLGLLLASITLGKAMR